MKELYLEVFSNISENGMCIAPIETAITLFTFKYCNEPPILLTFVVTNNYERRACLNIKISRLLFDIISESEVDGVADLCKLPLIALADGTTVVAGLCAVLRQVVKTLDPNDPLLGFKQSCLYACAETSIWTKFCEVDIINSVNILYISKDSLSEPVVIPANVARFEVHMSHPVKIHNIQKQKQKLLRLRSLRRRLGLPDNSVDVPAELEHKYSEGPEMTLADLILYTSIHVILEFLGSVFLKQHLPLTYKWYETMSSDPKALECLKVFTSLRKELENKIYVKYIVPNVGNQSLYKREMKRNEQRGVYTRQEDILECFEIVEDSGLEMELQPVTFGSEVDFDWTTVCSNFLFDEFQIPANRLERKGHQLKNLTKAVLKVAQNGDRIVDFCSGTGHLGLILAHALPRCQIIIVENKEHSLNRARDRALKLKLNNIQFCQCNVDYFKANFQVGVSLHACGVATDLVMETCIAARAAFVCCPCCYGSIERNHMIDYPRSNVFKRTRLYSDRYLILAHSSDQTHGEDNEKTSQGNKCMNIIDSDRCIRAKEASYDVFLSKLDPPSCTPKNNLLVGIPLF